MSDLKQVSQNLNPYMTDNLYGINQNTQGIRANSIFDTSLTSFGNNFALQVEEILTGTFTTAVVPGSVWNNEGSLIINFSDQSKSIPPNCLGFVTFSNQTYPLNYYDLDIVLATFGAQRIIRMKITNQHVEITAYHEFAGPTTYTITIYVLSNNKLN